MTREHLITVRSHHADAGPRFGIGTKVELSLWIAIAVTGPSTFKGHKSRSKSSASRTAGRLRVGSAVGIARERQNAS